MCKLVAQSRRNADAAVQAEVEKYLTGESEPSELIYFKVYRSQLPVLEQALEIAARMLGSDKSRGYCLEMVCADFLAGAAAGDNPQFVLEGIRRLLRFLRPAQVPELIRNLEILAAGAEARSA